MQPREDCNIEDSFTASLVGEKLTINNGFSELYHLELDAGPE